MHIPEKSKNEWRELLTGNSDIEIKNFFLRMKLTQAKKLLKKGEISLEDAIDQIHNLCINNEDVKHIKEDMNEILNNDHTTEKKQLADLNTDSIIPKLKIEKNKSFINSENIDELSSIYKENKLEISRSDKEEEEYLTEKELIMQIEMQVKREEDTQLAKDRIILEERMAKQKILDQMHEDTYHTYNQENVLNSNFVDSSQKPKKKKKNGFFKSLFGSDDSNE